METLLLEQSPQITFLNTPQQLPEDASEHTKKKHEKKMACIHFIETYIAKAERFKAKNVEVELIHSGVSSLVCIIETPDEKTVLKLPLSSKGLEGESDCLQKWQSVGVSVPSVLEEGFIKDKPYILMSFVDAKRLIDCAPEELEGKEISLHLGQILRQMHTTKAEGYGRIHNHKAAYSTFKEWLQDDDVQKRIKYVKKEKIIDENKHGSISTALKTLENFIASDPRSTYCHHDYGSGNAFNTDPITIFDPDPMINHPIIDISRSIVLTAGSSSNYEPSINQKLEGYFGDNPRFDQRAFQAAILLNAYSKLYNWHRSGKTERIIQLLEYLEKTNTSN